MVIGDQDVGLQWGCHSVPGSRGMESRTSVPPVGGPVMVSRAPMSIARSRMPRMPWEDGHGARKQSLTVIANGQDDLFVGALEPELYLGGVGVPGDVRERLLGDAVDRPAHAPPRAAAQVSRRRSTRTSRLLAERRRERRQRALQPEIFERLGAQPACDSAHFFSTCAGGLPKLVQLLAELARGSVAASPSTCSMTPVRV